MADSCQFDYKVSLRSEHACFGGWQRYYRHDSAIIGQRMRFGVYLPPAATHGKVPVLVFLPGLTCDHETFFIKAGAQRYAAEHGIALISPDTSPRGKRLPGDDEHWDFGLAAAYWLDATEQPWAEHYRMESYVMQEWLPLLCATLPLDAERLGISGHSVGGHGALTLALRHPGRFRSLSAFAPMCAATEAPWGQKAFGHFLGADHALWRGHDASLLMAAAHQPFAGGVLVDQGLADPFLETQLKPERLEAACASAQQALRLRRHEGYDHNYYFISSFIGEHIAHHAQQLRT